MKNFRILSLVASVFMMTATFAQTQNVITALDASIRQGKSGDLVLNYQFNEENKYTGVQFDITLPEGINLSTNNSDIIRDNCITSTNDVTWSVTVSSQNNNTYRFTINSNPTTILPGTEGNLLTLKLIADASISVGANLEDATIHDVKFITAGGSSVKANESTFKISIVEVPTVTLNESSEEEPGTAEDVNVKVIRTIKANEWSTICLPFEISEDKMASAFGDDFVLGDFTGCETTKTGNAVTSIKVNFVPASSIEANHPYIIRVSSKIESFTVKDVVISPTEKPSVKKDKKTESFSFGSQTITVDVFNEFIGTYVKTDVPPNSLFLNGNQFWYANDEGKTKMKALRGYFSFYDILDEKKLNSNITLAFDEADGINNVTVGQPVEGIYDIQGRKVHTDENKPLKKGVYIINGKKVVR